MIYACIIFYYEVITIYISCGCGYITFHCWLLLQGSSAEAKALATAISQKLDKLEKELKSALTTSVSINSFVCMQFRCNIMETHMFA